MKTEKVFEKGRQALMCCGGGGGSGHQQVTVTVTVTVTARTMAAASGRFNLTMRPLPHVHFIFKTHYG